jgi:flagellar protein FlaI
MLLTKIDKMVELIRRNNKITFEELGEKLKLPPEAIEKLARILETPGLLQIHYPLNPFVKPWITVNATESAKDEKRPQGKTVEEYKIKEPVEDYEIADAEVYFSPEEKRNRYFVRLPRLTPVSRAFLEHIKSDITRTLPISGLEKTKEELRKDLQERTKSVKDRIDQELGEDGDTARTLANIAVNEMYGLGDLEALVADKGLEEIIINSSKVPVAVYHRKYGWLKTNITIGDELDIENYSSQVARKVGRQITVLEPILDAHLVTGDRVNATLCPISTAGNTITLRLFARNPWTIASLVSDEVKSMSLEMAALLWQALHYEMNIIVAGGTASGKTSALNSLIALIPPHQRIITIEDTRELVLPSYQWNWVPLATREPNPEGLGEVSMLDLVVNSLRMRPDRIVMGEIRRKKEAEVLFEAMHTGHSVYGTLHADTGEQVIRRLIEPPIEVPPGEIDDIHLILVQYRDRRKNLRRTLELSEIIPGAKGPELNYLFKWRPRSDTFDKVKPPHRYTEMMNLHTGMTEREVVDDQAEKQEVLAWMKQNKVLYVDDVGKVMEAYYADGSTLLEGVRKGQKPERLLGGK